MSLLGIVLGLALLIFLAFKGQSILWVAPVCAAVVALLSMFEDPTINVINNMDRQLHGFYGYILTDMVPGFHASALFSVKLWRFRCC